MPSLRDRVEQAIEEVLDPCSRFNGTRISFIDLGMVDAIEADDEGRVLIRLLLDDPLCPYMPDIRTEMRQAALAVPGVKEVELRLRGDEIWTEDRLTEAGREKLARGRERRKKLIQIRPVGV